jgi:hypothetical protein
LIRILLFYFVRVFLDMNQSNNGKHFEKKEIGNHSVDLRRTSKPQVSHWEGSRSYSTLAMLGIPVFFFMPIFPKFRSDGFPVLRSISSDLPFPGRCTELVRLVNSTRSDQCVEKNGSQHQRNSR